MSLVSPAQTTKRNRQELQPIDGKSDIIPSWKMMMHQNKADNS
jgi:hypothetical protein